MDLNGDSRFLLHHPVLLPQVIVLQLHVVKEIHFNTYRGSPSKIHQYLRSWKLEVNRLQHVRYVPHAGPVALNNFAAWTKVCATNPLPLQNFDLSTGFPDYQYNSFFVDRDHKRMVQNKICLGLLLVVSTYYHSQPTTSASTFQLHLSNSNVSWVH